MGSLTSCVKKAGSALRAEDRVAIFAISKKYRAEGLSASEAAAKAVQDQIAAVEKLIESEKAASDELLQAQSQAEIVAKQDREQQAAKDKEKTDREAEKQAREDEDRKRIAQASEAAASTFELGGNAMDNLTGQGSIFDAPTEPEQTTAGPEVSVTKLEAEQALWDRINEGRASIAEFKAGFEAWLRDKDAIVAELMGKKKDELLSIGGPRFAMRYKSETKPEIAVELWRDGLGAYGLGKSVTYSLGKDSYQNAIRRQVEATDEAELKQHAKDIETAKQERAQRAEEMAKAVADPQTLADYERLIRTTAKEAGVKTLREALMLLAPAQRFKFDSLAAEKSREERKGQKQEQQSVRVAGQQVDGQIIETKHTQKGHDIFVVQLSERVSREDYETLNTNAKRMGGYYSSFRGRGAVPGFQFKDRATADAFVKLANGDTDAAQQTVDARRDAFADDRSQTAVERLTEMADKLESSATESLGVERKANTARRARFAAAAESAANAEKALAKTMRNIAKAITDERANLLDRIRTKTQVEMLTGFVKTAKDNELRAKYPSYADQEKRKGEPATEDTASYAEFPSFTVYRSDLASLARQLVEVDGTKKIGAQLMKVADDVSDAFTKFAKEPGNLFKLSAFSVKAGEDVRTAIFPDRDSAERAIKRSGLSGKAIVFQEKRGVNRIILSPSEAINRGVWTGDNDKRITLTKDFGQELVTAIGRRANKSNKLSVPWQFENASTKLKALERIGIETAPEFRTALREFIGLQERAQEADRVKMLERAMVGRKKDGLDFFPTPQTVADEMVEAADIQPDMAVLEPSAGMGHIADRIRAAGAEPDVIEMSGERRELLEEKGFTVVGSDFMEMKPRAFYTFGDVFRAPDGTEGVMRGGNNLGRVRLVNDAGEMAGAGYYNREDLTGLRHTGTESGYDRIIMNPPFSDRRDAEHVRHAYNLLKPGGRLVALMGEGVFFGKDKKAEEFRAWLEKVGGTDEKLAEGTFLDPTLPVNTGVSARMVVIEKPEGSATFARGAQTETEAFKKWFGDSKVVDADGKPLVVYHGTTKDFGEFAPGTGYFTADASEANMYGGFNDSGANVVPAYLSIKNPRVIESETMTGTPRDVIADALTDGDIDGVVVTEGGKVRWAVVTEPSQIKSATGNNGEFDPANPDIRYAIGPDAFSLGITPRKFMPVSDVQKAVDQLTAKWQDGPAVKVVQSAQDLPVDAPDDVRGMIQGNTAYIVAANHLDRAGVAKTLAHEAIGHYGLWKILGTDGRRQFERNLQLALKSGNKPLNDISARVRKLYVDERGKFNLSPAEEANEIAAFAVEEALDADGNFKPGFGFVKQVWAKIADFLRGLGLDIKFTNAELQGMLVSAMKGLEAGRRLDGGMREMVAAARDGDPERNALDALSQTDDLFKFQKSDKDSVEAITKDINPAITVKKLTNIPGETRYIFTTPDGNSHRMMVRPFNPYANEEVQTMYGFNLDENHEMTDIVTERPGKNADHVLGRDDVYIDVSLMQPGEYGSAIYAIAQNYAHNTGKVFIGDPSGLSDNAMKRRVENMLSSALKFGTTEHLAPHPRQVKGDASIGVPPLEWTYGDDLGNIKALIKVSDAIYGHHNPITFEPSTGRFVDSEGAELDEGAIRSIIEDGRFRKNGIGIATAKRNAVLSALVREQGEALRGTGKPGNGLLEKIVDLARQHPSATRELFYARGGVSQGLFPPTVWNTPDPTQTDKIIYELQDGRVDLKRVQQAIEKSGQQIVEKWDARLAETLYPGRVAYRSQQFLDTDVKPLLKAMATYGVPMDELADYLHARGAKERNAQVAKVNPDLPDGGAGKNSKGVLLTNQAAQDYLANITPARKQILNVLAAKVDAITAGTRSLLVTEGLEKQETIDAWTKTYKNYVPMFRDEAQSGAPHPQGSGFSVKGSASKRATGSTKEVTNILAHVLMQREAAITRAEKNRVALALYGQALSHPNPEFWSTIKPSMTAASIAQELQAMGVDPMTAAVGMERAPTVTTVDEATGMKVDRPNPLYKSLPGAIPLKVNGEDRVLMLNTENERGARLAENLKNLDGLTKLDLASSIVGKTTRWLASVNTQYNPAFGLVNVTRDTLGAAINLGSTEIRGSALKVLRDTAPAMQGIARALATDGGGKWGDLYRQFQADGGQTGWKENFRDASDRAKAIEKQLQSTGKLTPGVAAHAVLDLLDGFNTTMENAVRLSAYSAALDKGMSRPNAARLARELTVDFNRKGRVGREAGPLYAFFNASVQGTARTIETLRGPTGTKVILGGLGLGAMQSLMLLAAGYDDDEVPEFVKSRALVIPTNWSGKGEKRHVLIPYPLGLHVLPNTGRVITELALNGGKDIGKRVFGAVGEIAGAFNPLGGGNVFTADGALKTIAPTVVDPFIELGFNRNFAGNSIEREPFKGEADTRPGVARVKEATQRSTTGQAYIGISKTINAMTGGTDYEAGTLSPTPERVRYIAQTVGGGVLRELEKTINASTAEARGDKVKMSQIPVAGRFYGEVDDDQVKTSRYYDNAKKLDTLENTQKAIIKAGDSAAFEELQKKHPEIAMIKLGNRVQSALAQLNKVAVQTINDPEKMRELDETRAQIMDQLNQAVDGLESETQPATLGKKIKGWKRETVN